MDETALKDHVNLRFDSNDRALQLQAKEYDRRLDELNHSAERARQRDLDFLSREVFEAKHNLIEVRIQSLERIVFVGLGIVLALQFFLHFIKIGN